MDPELRVQRIQALARLKHERVAGGLPAYRPMLTLAWRDTVKFKPWPDAFWRSMQEIGLNADQEIGEK